MKSKEKNFVSAVIYVHNAAGEIRAFLAMILDFLQERFEHGEVICVNDDSRDESVSVIREFHQKAGNLVLSILNMSYFHGLEGAMAAGNDLAIGDFVLEFDSVSGDFSREQIWAVYEKALEGFDIVSAVPTGGGKQRFSSKSFYFLMNRFSNVSCGFYTERFRILTRRAINRIDSMNKTVPYRKMAYANCGLKTALLKYPVLEGESGRHGRQDKEESKYRRNLAVDTLILFTDVGYRFSVTVTIMMMMFAAVMAFYCVCIYLASSPIEGWTTMVMFLSLAFFGLFGILTIVIKYLQILVNLVFKRKQYSFESVEKLN